MSFILDDKSKFPGTNQSIAEYARACSHAIDEALKEWPIAETTKNAKVSTGFVGDNELLSTLWTQSFEVVGTEDKDNSIGNSSSLEDLLSNLKDLFLSDDLGKHAKEWDATFAGANILGKLSENGDTILVHWKFNASPLKGRDMLYLIHRLEEEEETNDGRILRLTYAYASVNDDWVVSNIGTQVEYTSEDENRVRAFNCYPSCDRITVYKDKLSGSGTKITVDHLMSSQPPTIRGVWIMMVLGAGNRLARLAVGVSD